MNPDIFLLKVINPDIPLSFLDNIMVFITNKGYVFFILFGIIAFLKNDKKVFLPLTICIIAWLVSDAIGNLLKHIIERPRPFNVIDDIRVLVGRGNSYSFPSNHAMTSFSVAAVLGYFFSYLRIPGYFVAILIGFSRIYVGVHYPSDVIGGGVLGILVAFSLIYGWKGFERFYLKDRISAIFFIFISGLLIARLYYIHYGPLELSPDEAHYWEWSRRPALSYYSKGPLIAYLIKISTMIGGVSEIGVRLFAPVFLFLSSIVLYMLAIELYNDRRIAVLSGILPQLIPLFATYGVVFTIDSPFLFFWSLSLLFFFRAIKDNRTVWWILLGVSCGVGMLAKYSMAFFYVCALVCVIIRRKWHLFGDIRPYMAIALTIIVFLPVIIWNIQNSFVTLRHTAGHIGVYEGLRINLKTFFEFIGSQIGVISPLFFITMMIPVGRELIRKDNSPDREEKSFLLSFSLPVLIFFLLKSLQAKVQANWPLMAYHTMFVYSSSWYINKWKELKRGLKILFISSLLSIFLITPLMHFPQLLGLSPKLDPSSRLRGWRELGRKITEVSGEMRRYGPFFIVSDRYQVSSEIAFYTEDNPVTYCVNLGRRMNQYDLWPGFYNFVHQNAIFVTIGDTDMKRAFQERFAECKKEIFRTTLREYSIFRCYDFKGMDKAIFDRY